VPRGVVKRFAEGFPGMAAMMNPISIAVLTILNESSSDDSCMEYPRVCVFPW
jgi:hypothetical protein